MIIVDKPNGRCEIRVSNRDDPHVCVMVYVSCWYLRPTVIDWLKENLPLTSWVTDHQNSVTIVFQTKEDSALFKLFWTNNTVES